MDLKKDVPTAKELELECKTDFKLIYGETEEKPGA